MKLLLGPIELAKYNDAQLADLLTKVKMMGGKHGVMHDSLKREIIRRKQVNMTPRMVKPSDEWIVDVAPGWCVTMSMADLMVSMRQGMASAQVSAQELEDAFKRLVEAGTIRPNPARTRVEEVR